ncbi:hypothetical protein [Streptomyces parvus]|uniref:hypothetical protein n=1 Tax=Streptomyces parvus TaxID=66428 RepID=UPI00210162AB|nr:hypothetical protein [Streptomyces parvus]MCQ1581764.1 hypothetical protein [Streptomyces parvus]
MDEETDPPEQPAALARPEPLERPERPEQSGKPGQPEPPAAGSVVCARCGTAAEGGTVPVTWLSSVEDGRRLHFCEGCARLHIRAIESRLDSLWW